jgi:pseudaminic acid synthase
MRSISINERIISVEKPPYVVAELSANHNGSIERALSLLTKCSEAGADAVKIQSYTPDTITLRSTAPEFTLKKGLWKGRTLYDLYKEAHTPFEWHGELFAHAKDLGITIFSSPFDATAVDLLEQLNAPAYKIASFEIIDIPLIEYVASTKKPMIISTGMATESEISEALDAARGAGCEDLALLKCVSGYPAPASDYHLASMKTLEQKFDTVVGLSDHTLSNTTAIASIALGASIIEKHVTLDRLGGGPDDTFSLQPDELLRLCEDAREAWTAIGSREIGPKKSEQENVLFRRSLYFVKPLQAGQLIEASAIKSVRPGHGLPPKFINKIIGKKVLIDVKYGDPVTVENTAIRL